MITAALSDPQLAVVLFLVLPVWSVVLTLARESLVTDKREDVAEASDTGTEAAVTQRQDSSGGAGSASTTQTGESSASDSVGAGNATSVAAVGKVEAIDRAVIDTAASKGRDLVVMVSAMIAGVEHNPGSLQRLLWGERRVANLFEGMEAGTARPQTTVTVSGVDSIPTYGSLWKRSREDSHSHSDEPSATRRRIQLLSYAPDGVLTVDEGSVIPPEAVGAAPAGEAAATSPEFEPAAESGSVEEGGAGITTDAGAAIARTVVLHEYLSKRDSLHRVFGTASLAAWAAAEDKQLLEALMSSGKRINWAPISAKLGRSVPACRKRAQELEGERPGR